MKNIYSKIIKFGFFILLITACCYGLITKFPNLNFLKKKPITIKNTALIIEESKKIAQLFSAKYYSEIVLDSTKYVLIEKTNLKESILSLKNISYQDSIKTEIVIIAKGNCFAGNNLDNIKINNKIDTCSLTLPNAVILNTVVNPSDFRLFYDGGNWTKNEVQLIKEKASLEIKNFAIKNGILDKANERTKKLLTNLLKSVGFKKVVVNFEDKITNQKVLK